MGDGCGQSLPRSNTKLVEGSTTEAVPDPETKSLLELMQGAQTLLARLVWLKEKELEIDSSGITIEDLTGD